MGLISRVSSRTYRLRSKSKVCFSKMFSRALRQTTRYATAFSSVQYRQLNNNNVIIPNFTHFTPIVQQKLDLSTSLVSSLSAEVQQMLMELSLTDDELPEEDETVIVLARTNQGTSRVL